MTLFNESQNYKLYQGSMIDMLEVIEKNSIDCIVTDPPYELNFMNKGWDNAGISFNKETWKKCFEVLKDGGYLLAFGGSRTYHRIACAIEDAGFEIRDCIMWIYGSGFPKSMNIGLAIDKKNVLNTNEWQAWGTALKPSYEPIIIARKPFKGSLVDNIIKNGVGGLNIDECRVETNEDLSNLKPFGSMPTNKTDCKGFDRPWMNDKNKVIEKQERAINKMIEQGRFPANTILTYDETDFEEVCGGFPNANGSASRYFYCAKTSKRDRDEGLELRKNIHTTVKPTELMQYLVRLVAPKGATILDPFNGSGSTGKAVMYENLERDKNYFYIGIDLSEEYLEISKARLDYVINKQNTIAKEKPDYEQIKLVN